MSPFIRPARSDDQDIIKTIVDRAYAMYLPRMGRKPGPMLDDHLAFITAGHTHVLEMAGNVAGVLVLVPAQGALLIQNVAVDPASIGQGHGKALLHFAEHEARRLGLAAVTLYTHVSMIENIALYGRIGFVETGRVIEHGLHRVYMRKNLA